MAIPVGTAVGYLDLDYSSFSKKLDTAVSEANSLSGKFADTIGSGLTTIGDKISSVGTKLTTSISVPLGLAMASAVKFGAEFDNSMSAVKAVTGATEEDFQLMRDAAIDWGEKTVYTASEASDALYYMGLAGWDANDSVRALGPVLSLAAAGNLELGRTSDIVTDAMTALQMEADEYTNGVANAEHFTNVLAAAMANSNTDVDQMGEAFKYVAPLAGSLGYSAEDLALALGNMANVGVKASQAGTGLRQALKNLITPANDTAAALMDELGISLFDTQGNALEFKDVLDNLREVFGGVEVDIGEMSEVLEKDGEEALMGYVDGLELTMSDQEKLRDIVQIFGTRALPGVLGIINATEEKYNDLADSIYGSDKAFVKFGDELMTYEEAISQFGEELVNTSKDFEVLGYAEGMAQVQMDNLQGDWVKFQSALGTTKIEVTDLVKGALRELVQKLTELVQWFNNLDDEQQKNILKWAGIIAAIGPALLVFGKIISGVGKMITAFNTIGGAITKLKVGFGMLGNLVGGDTFGAFYNLFKVAGPLQGTLTLLKAAISALLSPVGIVVVIVAALTAAFIHLMKTNEDFRNRIFEIWNSVKAKFEEAGQKILNAINAIGFDFTSIKEALSAGFDWFCNAVAPLLIGIIEGIGKTIGSIIDIVTGVFEIIGGLFQGFRDGDWSLFKQGLEDFFGGLFNLFTMPFQAAFMVITEYLTAFGTSWTEIWNGIVNFFTGIGDSISQTVENIHTVITDFIDGLINGFLNFHTNLWNNIAVFFYDLVMKVIHFFNDLHNSWEEFKSSIKQKIIEFIIEVVTRIVEFMISIKTKVDEMKESVIDKFNTLKTKVINTVTDFKNKVVSKYEEIKTNLITIVTNIRDGLVNKFNEMKTKLITIVTNIKNGIINVFNGIKEKFMEIGKNIVDGIWEGINSGWQWLKDKVKDLASSLLDAAKSALGIESPSKAFRDDFGYWLPLGAAEGVEDAMPKAVDEIQDAFDKGLSQIDGEVDITTSTTSAIDVVQEAINDVTVWFESTEERLREIVQMMRDDLLDLISIKDMLVTPEGIIIETTTTKPTDSLDVNNYMGEDSTSKGTVVNNYNYTFNSPKAIDEIEASRQLKNTQRDLSEGF